jgi:Oxidoreductase family, NAD-binding Rossmann fold
MKSFNIGFIGCGFVAQQCHLPAISSTNGLVPYAIADPHPDLRLKICRAYGIQYSYSNHHDLLENEQIDCVVITLPRRLAYGVVKESLQAGKHVFTEKPLCLNSFHAEELIQICETKKMILLPGYMRRYDAAVLGCKTRLNSIEYQDIISISAYCHMGNSYCSPFGDIKEDTLEDIDYHLEELPAWLPSALHKNYEQFINVFSHLTDLLEFIFDDRLILKDCHVNNWGEGILLCTITSIPLSISLMRGQQAEWREGIEILARTHSLQLSLQPAFLRSQPGFLLEKYGKSTINRNYLQPDWSWAFCVQAQALYDLLCDGKADTSFSLSASNQIRFAELLFKEYIC